MLVDSVKGSSIPARHCAACCKYCAVAVRLYREVCFVQYESLAVELSDRYGSAGSLSPPLMLLLGLLSPSFVVGIGLRSTSPFLFGEDGGLARACQR